MWYLWEASNVKFSVVCEMWEMDPWKMCESKEGDSEWDGTGMCWEGIMGMFWEKHWSLKWRARGSEDNQRKHGRHKCRKGKQDCWFGEGGCYELSPKSNPISILDFWHFFPSPVTKFQSQWLVSPIFPGQKPTNPNSHFTPSGPSNIYFKKKLYFGFCSETSDVASQDLQCWFIVRWGGCLGRLT